MIIKVERVVGSGETLDYKDYFKQVSTEVNTKYMRCQIKAEMEAINAKIRFYESEISREPEYESEGVQWRNAILSEIRHLNEKNKIFLEQLIKIGL